MDTSNYTKTVPLALAQGKTAIDIPRCQSLILQCIGTSSLAFTLQSTFGEDTPFYNHASKNHLGKRFLRGRTVTPAEGDILYLDAIGLRKIQITPTVGGGTILVRASDYPAPTLKPVLTTYSFIPDATDELLVVAGESMFWGVHLSTIDATPVYVKMYDKATAASESDTPFYRYAIPANSTSTLAAGSNAPNPEGVLCTLGLSVRAVTGIADNSDTALTAAENYVNVLYE